MLVIPLVGSLFSSFIFSHYVEISSHSFDPLYLIQIDTLSLFLLFRTFWIKFE